MATDVERIPLTEAVKEGRYLQLPCRALAEVGPATITLGAVRSFRERELFRPVSAIAERAGIGKRTCVRHLETLVNRDWLIRKADTPRRTNSYGFKRHIFDKWRPFLRLPCWFLNQYQQHSARVLFACIVNELDLTKAVKREDLLLLKVTQIAQRTGLSRRAVFEALRLLESRNWIKRTDRGIHGIEIPVDQLRVDSTWLT